MENQLATTALIEVGPREIECLVRGLAAAHRVSKARSVNRALSGDLRRRFLRETVESEALLDKLTELRGRLVP